MTDDRERWALILGGSSGMGEATALALATAGYNICGIHLDFRAALAHVEEVKAAIAAAGAEALYINMNAADDEKRAARARRRSASASRRSRAAGRDPTSASSCIRSRSGRSSRSSTDDPKGGVDRKKMEMTQDVMANSLVYWVQDLWRGGFLGEGSKIYAMTSEGSTRVVPVVRRRVVRQGRARVARPPAGDGARAARHRGRPPTAIRAGVTMTPGAHEDPRARHDHRRRRWRGTRPAG